MRRLSTKLAVFLALFALAGLIVAPGVAVSKKKPEIKTEEDVNVDPEVLDDLSDAAYLYLDEAREHFQAGEFEKAAEDYRTAASFLRLEANREAEKYEGELKKEAKRMDKFADEIEQEAVKNLKEFDREVSHAYQSLAEHHYERAMEQWTEKQYQEAAQSMRQAARQMERSAEQGEQEIEKEYEKAIEDTREAARKIEEKSEWASDQASENFKDLGKKIKKWGNQIEKEIKED